MVGGLSQKGQAAIASITLVLSASEFSVILGVHARILGSISPNCNPMRSVLIATDSELDYALYQR